MEGHAMCGNFYVERKFSNVASFRGEGYLWWNVVMDV